MGWTMTRAEKRYDKKATKQFKKKYRVLGKNQNVKKQSHIKLANSVNKQENIPCEGSSKCNKRRITARFKTFDGQFLCNQCYMRYRRKKLKSQPAVKIPKKPEFERRKEIFSKWKNPELDAFRKTEEYQKWRIEVLERDLYTCQHCQKTGGKLHVHHVKTAKMNKDIRLDVNNGIVLCKGCHGNLHIGRYDKYASTVKLNAG